ncbi:MAG TPA: Hsp20/alpha crystallin family protein [Burkholderiaceae bacterium]
MTDRNDLTTPQSDRDAQRASLPAVDIYEDAGGITLLADMPGVSRERLDVRLDSGALTIEGTVDIAAPEGLRPLWAELAAPRYRRSFTLSRELDTARIEANLKDGVLSLRIPKQAHAQPRRIAVNAG